ncbi:hypothetical protein C8F04DRAFT_1204298, partial [Mycena alexandri]
FLDLDAELSGADEDSDDPNEDEETLSDKEFLDDEPIHDVVPASSFRRVADDPDEGDELRAIARHYDDEAARDLAVPQQARPAAAAAPRPPMPLAAGTWIRYRRELSFVVSSRELLQVKKTGRKLKRVILKTELTDEKHRPVIPIRDHTERFRAADPHPSMAKATFIGLCPALAAGDRVVVVSGEFEHKMGPLYIWSLREVAREGKRVRMARVAEFNDGEKFGRFDVEVCHLKRHILDAFCPIQVHDRVCVVSGVIHRGLSGRVTELSDGLVSATDGEFEFTVDMRHVARDLRRGDVVRVTRGQFTGCIGLILHIGLGGSLEIWDAERSDNSNSENPSDEVQAQLLPVRSRNVELVDYQMAAYSAPYTRTSEVGARPLAETVSDEPDPECERVREQIINLGQRLNDYNADDAPLDDEKTRKEIQDLYMSNIAKLSEKMAIPLTAADVHDIARVSKNLGLPSTVHERDRRLKEAELKFAYTGHRFEGIDVKIIRGANKGVHGEKEFNWNWGEFILAAHLHMMASSDQSGDQIIKMI